MSDHEKMTHERRVDQNALAHAARHLLSKQSIAAGVVLELGDGAIVAAGQKGDVLMLLKPSPVAPEQDQAIADATEMSAKYEGGTQLIASLMTEVNDLRERIGHLNEALKLANDCLAGRPAAHIASKPSAEPLAWMCHSAVEPEFTADALIAGYWMRKGRTVMPLYATPAASAPTAPESLVHRIADSVMGNLEDRKGVFEDIDDEIMAEIRDDLGSTIRKALATAPVAPAASADAVIEAREQADKVRNTWLDRAIEVCENERVESTGTDGDTAYNMAINHCAKALRALRTQATKGE